MEVLNNPFAAKKFMSRRDVCGCEQTLERGSRPQRLLDNNHEVPSLSFRPLGCQFPMTQQMSPPSARPGAGLWAQRERERSVMFLCSRRSQLDGGGRPPSNTRHPADGVEAATPGAPLYTIAPTMCWAQGQAIHRLPKPPNSPPCYKVIHRPHFVDEDSEAQRS